MIISYLSWWNAQVEPPQVLRISRDNSELHQTSVYSPILCTVEGVTHRIPHRPTYTCYVSCDLSAACPPKSPTPRQLPQHPQHSCGFPRKRRRHQYAENIATAVFVFTFFAGFVGTRGDARDASSSDWLSVCERCARTHAHARLHALDRTHAHLGLGRARGWEPGNQRLGYMSPYHICYHHFISRCISIDDQLTRTQYARPRYPNGKSIQNSVHRNGSNRNPSL